MATEYHSSSPSQDTNIPLTSSINAAEANDKGEEDIGLSLSDDDDEDEADGKSEHGEDTRDEEDRRIEKIGDENPHLMAYLDNSESNNSNAIATSSEEEDNDEDADLDDSRIEAEEELAIRADYKAKPRTATIPGPVSLRRLSQSQHARNQNGADSDDSESSEDAISEASSWGNDFLEDYFDLPANDQRALNSRQRKATNHFDHDNDENEDEDDEEEEEQNDDNTGRANKSRNRHRNSFHQKVDSDPGEDSYLWQYFFSSDENNANPTTDDYISNPTFRARQRRISKSKRSNSQSHPSSKHTDEGLSTDDDLPMKGRGPLAPDQMAKVQPASHYPSGDSTDEDDGVPPERKRKRARGSKAIEVLGSNSFSARPPILGSWRIKGDKNVGIIDGLTTRTLSPPPVQRHLPSNGGSQSASFYEDSPAGDTNHSEEPRDPFEGLDDKAPALDALGDFTDFGDAEKGTPTGGDKSFTGFDESHLDEEVSDLDLLELGDFINTEALSSDENDQQFEFDLVFDPQQSQQSQSTAQKPYKSPVVSPYLYRNSRMSNRNAPIPAFRNRGSPHVSNVAYPSESFSPAPRRPSRRSSSSGRRPHGRDFYFSPANTKRKTRKSKLGGRSGGMIDQNGLGYRQEDGQDEHDFIGELIEIGAISPLFEIDQ